MLLADILVLAHEPRKPLLKEINAMALYPTESLLWDETQLPVSDYTTDTVLALPKLNLQVRAQCAWVCPGRRQTQPACAYAHALTYTPQQCVFLFCVCVSAPRCSF